MKKQILTLALVLAALCATEANAQNTNLQQTTVQVNTLTNRMSVGVDPSVASPTTTLDVSGTSRIRPRTTTPTEVVSGTMAVNGLGNLCIISSTAASFVKVVDNSACNFSPAN